MSEQKASTEALRGLVENMQSLSEYCDALRQGAAGAEHLGATLDPNGDWLVTADFIR